MATVTGVVYVNQVTLALYPAPIGARFRVTGGGYDGVLRVSDYSGDGDSQTIYFTLVSGSAPIGPQHKNVSITPLEES